MAIFDDKNALLGDCDNKDTPGVIMNLAPRILVRSATHHGVDSSEHSS